MSTTKSGKPAAGKTVAVKKIAAKKVAVARKAAPPKSSPVSASTAAARLKPKTKPATKTAAPKNPPVSASLSPAAKSNGKAHAATVVVAKPRKPKLVRDSFTMQAQEYQVLTDIKQAFKANGDKIKKSDLVRVAVGLLPGLELAALKALLARLP